ncbi:MAG: HRDC domain-containing protein, partial [Candidatus Polarisedimenticolia bacterium]
AEAKRRRVPAYVIFHDTTLAALAAARPRDREGLGAVKGMGPAKIDAYGETLLSILAGGPTRWGPSSMPGGPLPARGPDRA